MFSSRVVVGIAKPGASEGSVALESVDLSSSDGRHRQEVSVLPPALVQMSASSMRSPQTPRVRTLLLHCSSFGSGLLLFSHRIQSLC